MTGLPRKRMKRIPLWAKGNRWPNGQKGGFLSFELMRRMTGMRK